MRLFFTAGAGRLPAAINVQNRRSQMPYKILIPMDESDNAMRAVEFVAKRFHQEDHITLFNVMLDTAALCNMESPELTPLFRAQQSSFCTLENKKRELIQETAERARDILVAAGFPADNITIKIENRKSGVARDILNEAKNGYDLIAIGRHGTSGIKEFFSGSISNKVFSSSKNISVLVVD